MKLKEKTKKNRAAKALNKIMKQFHCGVSNNNFTGSRINNFRSKQAQRRMIAIVVAVGVEVGRHIGRDLNRHPPPQGCRNNAVLNEQPVPEIKFSMNYSLTFRWKFPHNTIRVHLSRVAHLNLEPMQFRGQNIKSSMTFSWRKLPTNSDYHNDRGK